MKLTIVEFLNDDNAWTWWRIFKNKTPLEALKKYIKEHDLEENPEQAEIEQCGGDYYYQDEVRAYEIETYD